MRKRTPFILLLVVAVSIGYYLKNKHRFHPYGLSGTGTIEATEIQVGSPLGGIIADIRFAEGNTVSVGESIAIIQHDELLAQKRAWESSLLAYQAQIKQAEIKYLNARRNLERLHELAKAGSIPQKDFDDAEFALREAALGLESARHQRENIYHQLEALTERIKYATITAPINGLITRQHFEKGELVPPGAPIATIADLSEVWLKIYLPENWLGQIRLGQTAQVTIDSLPGKIFPGRVTWISSQAEFTPKNIQTQEERVKLVYAVKITIPNPEGILKIGMPADARILTE